VSVAPDSAELASALRVHIMRLARRLRAERESSGHTLSQFAALASIERHGPMSPGDLAARERVQPPSMTRIVARLEEEGLVSREPHPTDRRQQLLTATDAGRELLAADRLRRDVWLAQQLGGLSSAEQSKIADVLPLLEKLAQT
jgi:DNA-binding MarR family transcriptional regulator